MRAGRIIAIIVGGLLAVTGFAGLAGGTALAVATQVVRGVDGFYQSPDRRVNTETPVLVAAFEIPAGDATGWQPAELLGTLRISATGIGNRAVFVGLAPAADVQRWLTGVAYREIDAWSLGGRRSDTRLVPGGPAAAPPGKQRFWVAQAAGPGTQTLTWPAQSGSWAVVLMNADAQPGVDALVSVGTNTDVVLPVGLTLAGIGLLLLALGITVMLLTLAGTAAGAGAEPQPQVPGSYPARLDGQPAPVVRRWLWLVKWLLALPHLVVLALLWLAVIPLTVVAGVAILFTARYPRAIFEFTVGVLRWGWRVIYYAFNVLGTDRYPPFSLRSDPAYPADFNVAYPARLSRGLVLVKWWLLAIPHYLVVSLLTGGWSFAWSDDWQANTGGLIEILVIVAAVILLFTGRYPQQLYDLIMGLNRWCYRVLAYAVLLRDDYPPFRLDLGGADPGTPVR